MKILIVCAAAAALAFRSHAADEIAFRGELPTDLGWTVSGGLEPKLIEDEGKKVVELKDEVDTAFCLLTYVVPKELESEIAERGFVMETRLKCVVDGRNEGIILRLASLGDFGFQPGRDEKKHKFVVSTPSGNQEGNKTDWHIGYVEGLDEYVKIRAEYVPGGEFTVTLNDKPAYSFPFPIFERPKLKSVVQIGGRAPDRVGNLRIEYFRLAPR